MPWRRGSTISSSHRHDRLTHYDLDRRTLPIRLRDAAARLLLPYL
jgi:cardiolipin synthase